MNELYHHIIAYFMLVKTRVIGEASKDSEMSKAEAMSENPGLFHILCN